MGALPLLTFWFNYTIIEFRADEPVGQNRAISLIGDQIPTPIFPQGRPAESRSETTCYSCTRTSIGRGARFETDNRCDAPRLERGRDGSARPKRVEPGGSRQRDVPDRGQDGRGDTAQSGLRLAMGEHGKRTLTGAPDDPGAGRGATEDHGGSRGTVPRAGERMALGGAGKTEDGG